MLVVLDMKIFIELKCNIDMLQCQKESGDGSSCIVYLLALYLLLIFDVT
jgi:hypothetical protein